MKRFLLALALPLLAGALPAMAATITGEGGLPKDLSVGEVPFTLTISGINSTQRAALSADQDGDFSNNLTIKVPAVGGNNLPFSADAVVDPENLYIEIVSHEQGITTDGDTGNTTSDTFDIVIHAVGDGVQHLKDSVGAGPMELKITYDAGDTSIAAETSVQLKREIYVLNGAPAFRDQGLRGSIQKLQVYWTHETAVNIVGVGVSGTKTPTKTNVYYLPRDTAGTLSLPAKTFAASADADDAVAECTYTVPVEDRGTCVTCPTNTYLDREAIIAQDIVKVVQVNSSSQVASIPRLEDGREYVVFMQWEPSAIQVSQCAVATPKADISLTELNGEGDARFVDFRCFIATAAYGTPLHADLDLFRGFRDQVLMRSWLGRMAVAAYYTWSPPLADFIAAHPLLKDGAHFVLTQVADLLRADAAAGAAR